MIRPCLDCNEQFCMSHNPVHCQEGQEIQISSECLQKDLSFVKDQMVVVLFLSITIFLTLYTTVIKAFLDRRQARTQPQYDNIPLSAV